MHDCAVSPAAVELYVPAGQVVEHAACPGVANKPALHATGAELPVGQ
jgi:hypothetical protein